MNGHSKYLRNQYAPPHTKDQCPEKEKIVLYEALSQHVHTVHHMLYTTNYLTLLFLMAPSFQNINNYSSKLDLVRVQFLINSD